MDDRYDYLYKIVLIGDSNVGKTNILSRFTKDEFSLDSKATVGVEFSSKCVKINNSIIKAQIWDTAGQERYRSITSAYYRGAVGALMVYDITSRSSFENVEGWLSELRQHSEGDMVVILIGNKCDLANQRCISTEEAIAYAEKHNMAFIETSAYDKTGIDAAFTTVLKEIYELTSSNSLGATEGVSNAMPLEKKTIKISLNSNFEEEETRKKCC
ncbi:RAS-like protein [Blastocystis sp. subtype 4]|uniref:RAS-like protein n=1 Tax=Blastocystis sp. subtype 4 TaxID=944170 RepID=UPI00071157D9|nr:RAS-like protein [Blastocystis sp. subtype 4]KNB46831.1 RAS-like protein [Blastocystis sp. subtype 4]|eukprot:XP_014530274.1 RAS-like protein [Blastocystis sp. subtype 4]